jgi:NADPH-dependent 2,4-dienoyl-CoA reductase/sulfur reductase-like enzyme
MSDPAADRHGEASAVSRSAAAESAGFVQAIAVFAKPRSAPLSTVGFDGVRAVGRLVFRHRGVPGTGTWTHEEKKMTTSTSTVAAKAADMQGKVTTFDAVVIGAGVAGMYQLYRLRQQGLNVVAIEAGSAVGGTWYWNR